MRVLVLIFIIKLLSQINVSPKKLFPLIFFIQNMILSTPYLKDLFLNLDLWLLKWCKNQILYSEEFVYS